MEKNRSKNFRSRTLIPSAGDKFRKQTWSLVATRQGRKNKKWKEKKGYSGVVSPIELEHLFNLCILRPLRRTHSKSHPLNPIMFILQILKKRQLNKQQIQVVVNFSQKRKKIKNISSEKHGEVTIF